MEDPWNGVGSKCINALSTYCLVSVCRDGKKKSQEFSRGIPVTDLQFLGKTQETGTTTSFIPDDEILHTTDLDPNLVLDLFEKSSYLNKGLQFKVYILKNDEVITQKSFLSQAGLPDYITKLDSNFLMNKPIYFENKSETKETEIIFNYNPKSENEIIVSFVNGAETSEHGTHVTGFKMGLSKVVLAYIEKNKMIPKKEGLIVTGDDIKEGLVCIINAKYEEPEFEGQTKTKLSSKDMQGFSQVATTEYLNELFSKNPKIARLVCEKAIISAKSRLAAKRSKERSKKESSKLFSSLSSISKYSSCETKKPEERELWICEGKSGGGSINEARDTYFQSKYALRGKPLNAYETPFHKITENAEFSDLISILNIRFDKKGKADISDLRYHKIMVASDSDSDGSFLTLDCESNI